MRNKVIAGLVTLAALAIPATALAVPKDTTATRNKAIAYCHQYHTGTCKLHAVYTLGKDLEYYLHIDGICGGVPTQTAMFDRVLVHDNGSMNGYPGCYTGV